MRNVCAMGLIHSYKFENMRIIGKYKRTKLYNNIYEYTCQEGYHFESFGVNYGSVVFGSKDIENSYIIKPNDYEEMVNNNSTNNNITNDG